ncbi:hypothetical protein [Ensifer aridi]|uniref:hypothetical protein n=1 Tax=Ensifer aridi TaxID=1708715 RepID=UPI0009BD0985|nr:hypothetical protein [Ensifer aridi]
MAPLIDGEWIEETITRSETVLNPATEQPLSTLPRVVKAELDRALTATSHREPVASTRRVAAMDGLISDALAHQALLITGGKGLRAAGLIYKPTVLADVLDHIRAMNKNRPARSHWYNLLDDVEQASPG